MFVRVVAAARGLQNWRCKCSEDCDKRFVVILSDDKVIVNGCMSADKYVIQWWMLRDLSCDELEILQRGADADLACMLDAIEKDCDMNKRGGVCC